MKRIAILIAGLLVYSSSAWSAEYPTKPIRLIVPYAAGTTGESAFRLLAAAVEPKLGQPFVIEPRPGAAGNIGAGFVSKSDPDGYTLLLGATNNFAINQYLYTNMGFDPTTAFEPVSILVDLPFFVYGSPQLAAATFDDVIALAKRQPGKLNYASSGIGSPMHLGGEMLQQVAGIALNHVPYRSNAQSTAALIANDVQLYIGLIAGARELAQAGKLKILATAGPTRSSLLPEISSAGEVGFAEFKISNWWAVAAPRGTPQLIVEALSRMFASELASPAVKERLLAIGMVPIGSTPKDFADQIKRESSTWSEVIKKANIVLN